MNKSLSRITSKNMKNFQKENKMMKMSSLLAQMEEYKVLTISDFYDDEIKIEKMGKI